MGIIVIIPAIIALIVGLQKSPQKAFIKIYLPVLLVLPDYYRWMLPALPDPSFSQATILAVTVTFLLKSTKKWHYSFADFLVGGFTFSVAYSEYLNAGYNEAQNLMVDQLCWVLLPYLMAKGLVEPYQLRYEFAKQITWLIFLISIISLYEFKFGSTPFRLVFDRFFPGQGDVWVTTFRHGFARVAGPYGHAIIAGLLIVVAYRIQCWLIWSKVLEPNFQHLKELPISKGTIMRLGILAGSIMTMCRGPWIGGLIGLALTLIGKTKNRWRAVILILSTVILLGVPSFLYMLSYASVGRANALTESQETAAYRKELIDKYVDIALERSVWGWGRNTWPKVAGMPSIDNYYLLLALMHGLASLSFFLLIFLSMMLRLFWRSMKEPKTELLGSSLGFTLLGIYAAYAFSIATVYLGGQAMPVFFLITGWAEGYLLSKSQSSVSGSNFKFKRLIK